MKTPTARIWDVGLKIRVFRTTGLTAASFAPIFVQTINSLRARYTRIYEYLRHSRVLRESVSFFMGPRTGTKGRISGGTPFTGDNRGTSRHTDGRYSVVVPGGRITREFVYYFRVKNGTGPTQRSKSP